MPSSIDSSPSAAETCHPTADRPNRSLSPENRGLLHCVRQAMEIDLRSLAAMRIGLGLILVGDALLRAQDAPAMFAPHGMLPPDLVRQYLGGPWSWSVALWFDPAWWGETLLVVEGVAGLLLAVGVATRCTSLVAWVAVVSVVRRTAPATNAGDVLLACLLFWGMFLPLGAVWSVDSLPRQQRLVGDRSPETSGTTVTGIATAALVLQVAAVYFSAGLSKCNGVWWSGDAFSYALSIHDHGSPWGAFLAAIPWLSPLGSWAVMLLEIVGPLLLLWPAARIPLVALFVIFHAAIAILMDVCLFPAVGLVAWMVLLPTAFWDRLWGPGHVQATPSRPAASTGNRPWQNWLCATCLGIAVLAFLHTNGPWRTSRLTPGIRHAVGLTFLEQDWSMFGEIRRQQQWVYGRAVLADGDVVDILRAGRPLETVLPSSGFHGLGNQRRQKLFWELPKPGHRAFAESIAATVARDWNGRHSAQQQVISLELHGGRLLDQPDPGTVQDVLLAAWPPRSSRGRGNLDRLLQASPRDTGASAASDASDAPVVP